MPSCHVSREDEGVKMDDEIDWGGRILAGLLIAAFISMGVMGLVISRDWTSTLFVAICCGVGCGIVLWVMKEPPPVNNEDPPA